MHLPKQPAHRLPRLQSLVFLPKQSGPRDGSCHPHLKNTQPLPHCSSFFLGENLEVNQEKLLGPEEVEGHKKSVVSLKENALSQHKESVKRPLSLTLIMQKNMLHLLMLKSICNYPI